MGKTEGKLIQQALRAKEEIPEAIRNAPELFPGLEFFYGAFWDLNTTRSMGMAEGYIPITAVWSYGDRLQLDEETQHHLEYLVKVMDMEYINYRQQEMEKKKPPKGAKAPRGK